MALFSTNETGNRIFLGDLLSSEWVLVAFGFLVLVRTAVKIKCQMYVYSGHALSYTKLVLRHATQTEGNKYFK